jgi:hypothetical protein
MSRIEDTNSALADPELLGDICAHVSIGGTLVNFCGEHEPVLNYKLINRWIEDDSERAKRYKLALDIREQHAKDLIIAELIAYLKADITEAFDREGNLKRMHDMPAPVRRLVAGIKFREIFERQQDEPGGKYENVHVGNMIEVKFWDKPRSMETFMKHLSMLIERKDINVRASLADLVAGSLVEAPKQGQDPA